MSTATATAPSRRPALAESERPVNGAEIRATGNLTRDPFTGEHYTEIGLASSRSYKKNDEWVSTPPTYLKVRLRSEAHENAPTVKKGDRIEVQGPLEMQVRKDERTGKEYSDLVVTVFGKDDIRVIPKKGAQAQGANAARSAQAGDDEPPF